MPSVSLPAVAAVAAVAGAGVAAYGTIESGQAQSASAKYNAQIAQQNQQLAKQSAVMAGQAGEAQAAQQQQKTRAEVGAITTARAASGVDANSGSALDVRSSAAELGELNALTIRENATKEAYGYETQGIGFGNQANLEQSQAANDVTAGEVGGAGTLLGGMGNAGSNYSKFLQSNSRMNA